MSTTFGQVISEGTTLQFKVSTVYTEISNVVDIQIPSQEPEKVPTDHLKSTVLTSRPCHIPDPGELAFTVYHDPNNTYLQTLRARSSVPGTIDDWKVIYNDGFTTPSNDTFSGWVSKYEVQGIEKATQVMAKITVVLTTVITPSPGA